MSEAIALSRALLAGEPVRHAGAVFQVADRRLVNGAGRVPNVLGSLGAPDARARRPRRRRRADLGPRPR
ncbi:MAG: hypothetical protein WDO24_23810 [Pseudomonadota bacterium]